LIDPVATPKVYFNLTWNLNHSKRTGSVILARTNVRIAEVIDMASNGYLPVRTCEDGKEYYLKLPRHKKKAIYKRVVFWSYRPNPAEIIVFDGDLKKLAYRSDLFCLKELD
jgi:hypothetical protein